MVDADGGDVAAWRDLHHLLEGAPEGRLAHAGDAGEVGKRERLGEVRVDVCDGLTDRAVPVGLRLVRGDRAVEAHGADDFVPENPRLQSLLWE